LSKGKEEKVKIAVPYRDAIDAFLRTPPPHKKKAAKKKKPSK